MIPTKHTRLRLSVEDKYFKAYFVLHLLSKEDFVNLMYAYFICHFRAC